MSLPLQAYIALDIVSAGLMLVVVAFFVDSWQKTGNRSLLLFALGFLFVGASFSVTSASQFDLGRDPHGVDALRLMGQLGGALVLFLAYVSARWRGGTNPWIFVGWGAAALCIVLAALYWIVPPFSSFPSPQLFFPAAWTAMFVLYVACTGFAAASFIRSPRLDRALVPAAFGCWAMSKYTWLLIGLTAGDGLELFVYYWRFLAVTLLVLAVRPPTMQREVASAEA